MYIFFLKLAFLSFLIMHKKASKNYFLLLEKTRLVSILATIYQSSSKHNSELKINPNFFEKLWSKFRKQLHWNEHKFSSKNFGFLYWGFLLQISIPESSWKNFILRKTKISLEKQRKNYWICEKFYNRYSNFITRRDFNIKRENFWPRSWKYFWIQ